MIDFHTHILPNIDDGSQSIEETINLIKEAKNTGFDGVVLSSHYKQNFFDTYSYERKILMDIVKDNIKNNTFDMDLYIASEIYICDNILELLEKERASSLNNSSYVLFEMPLKTEPENLYNMIYTLNVNKLIPVLAHPERYEFIYKDPELVNDLIEKGVLMQGNYGSILGQYGKKAKFIIKKLLAYDMIHFLGTDVHKENTIYEKVPKALEEIERIIGKEKLDTITTTNPYLALNNKKIEILQPKKIKFDLKDKLFFLKGM